MGNNWNLNLPPFDSAELLPVKQSGLSLMLEKYKIWKIYSHIFPVSTKIVARRREEQLLRSYLRDNYQSVYHRDYLTDHALLKVQYVDESLGEGSIARLIMSHLFPVFDVIDHPILIKWSEYVFVTKESVLIWLISYLPDITQCISVPDKISPDVGLHVGVQWGSILGSTSILICGLSCLIILTCCT